MAIFTHLSGLTGRKSPKVNSKCIKHHKTNLLKKDYSCDTLTICKAEKQLTKKCMWVKPTHYDQHYNNTGLARFVTFTLESRHYPR